MTRRSRRSLPATLVALVVVAACVLVTISSIQVLAGRRPLIPFADLARYGEHLHWDTTVVLAAGAAAAGAGLVLLLAGLWPGKPAVLPLAPAEPPAGSGRPGANEPAGDGEATGDGEPPGDGDPAVRWCPADAGVTRRGLRTALRATLADTEEVSKPKVRVRRRHIITKARTESHDTTTVHGRAVTELDRALATVTLNHPPRLRLHVSRARRSA
jgi:hypothetical protein